MEKNVIWKYEIEIRDNHVIDIPAHGEILHLGVQNEQVYIWVKVNPYNKGVKRTFRVCGTGHPIEEREYETLSHIGTFQFNNGFVGHVFEIV